MPSRSEPTPRTSSPGATGNPPRPPLGTIARRNSEPGCLAQPSLEARDGPKLAEQPDLADRDGPWFDRPLPER